MKTSSSGLLALLGMVATSGTSAVAQGVVVDQGQLAIAIAGRPAGTEDFVIRRAGLGREDAVFANGSVSLRVDGGMQEVKPLLRATLPEGVAAEYQVVVTGPDAMQVVLQRSGARYVATISSAIGEESREFRALPETRVVERFVAHHYYFLRDLREGRTAHVLEPRTRREITLVAGARTDEEIQVGRNLVQARRVEFTAGDERRIVWYDRLGRVLRVEIPSAGYRAERTDLVG
jgi:hypothetical protein